MNITNKLTLNKGKIMSILIKYYERSIKLNKYYINYQGDALSFFSEDCYTRINRLIPKFKAPDIIDDKYDAIKDFVTKFFKYEYAYAVLNVDQRFRRLKLKHGSEIFISELNQGIIDTFENKGESMESIVENSQILEQLKKLNDSFFFYLNSVEKLVFSGMLEGRKYKDLVIEIGVFASGKSCTEDDLRRIRNIIEYRLLCHYGFYQIFTNEKILKGLNLHSSLNKKFFGIDELFSLPELAELKEVAIGDFERFPLKIRVEKTKLGLDEISTRVFFFDTSSKLVEGRRDFRWKSKKSLDGKFHKTYKSYINSSGWIYDHSTKQYGLLDEKGRVEEPMKA